MKPIKIRAAQRVRHQGNFGCQVLVMVAISSLIACLGVSRAAGDAPEQRTAVGGFVRGISGEAIPGASISVNSVTRDVVGQSVEAEIQVVKSGEDGHWTVDRVTDAAIRSLTFKLSHPGMLPVEYYVAETSTGNSNEVLKADLLAGTATMNMRPRLAVVGRAVDAAGNGISGASAFLRTDAEPVDFHTTTGSNGWFGFKLLRPGEGLVAVAAEGFAPEMVALKYEEDLKPIELRLAKGKILRGRVVRPGGAPVRDAAVDLAWWNDVPFPVWKTYTDAEGRFTWNAAPLTGAFYRVTAPGFGSAFPQTVEPGEDEAVLWLARYGLVNGKVIDAATRKPIPSFQVVKEEAWERGPKDCKDGKYCLELEENRFIESVRVRVEAEGYLPEVSPPLPPKGVVIHDFELKKGHGPIGTVRLPNGPPADNAQVAVLARARLLLKNRALVARNPDRECCLVRTDRQGKFELPAIYAVLLVACHAQGYAEVQLSSVCTNLEINLEPWGTIQGTVWNGKRPATNEWIAVTRILTSNEAELEYDPDSYRTLSDSQGRFILTDVPPGERYLARAYTNDSRPNWSHAQPFNIRPGAATEIQFGGGGRRVIGKVVASDPGDKFSWESGSFTLHTRFEFRAAPAATDDTRGKTKSPTGKKAAAPFRSYAVKVQPDGSFAVEDVPAGRYSLALLFRCPDRRRASVFQDIEVPQMPNASDDAAVDLGNLRLRYNDSDILW